MRRAKLLSVLAIIAGSGLLLISTTQTWLTVSLTGAEAPLEVAGSAAAPLVAPLALAGLALGLALSIAGRILRPVLAVLAVAIGLGAGYLAARLAIDPPVEAFAATVTDATGIAGADAIAALVSGLAASAWPAIAAGSGFLVAAAGLTAAVTARQWQRAGRRYEASSTPSEAGAPRDAIDAWDDLSRGSDPTS